jgi:hypothetical protein
MGFDILGGDNQNSFISTLKSYRFLHTDGKIVISPKNSDIKSAVIISDEGVNLTNPNGTCGLFCGDGAVTIQGTLYNTSKGTSIRKGEYSENERTKKIFTYRETVLFESIPTDVASQAAGQAGVNISMPTGTNSSIGLDGIMNIITDVSAGPIPHVHSISMKHVHRVEPGHLYRIPSMVGVIKSCLAKLTGFLNA